MTRRLLPLSRIARLFLAAALWLAALLAAGCATLGEPSASASVSRAELDAFSIEGRFSLRHDNKNYSGRLSWRHSAGSDEVLLASPFGQGIAQISAGDSGAQLVTSDGQVYSADNSEQLTRQVLGYPLPLAQLADWVRGRGAGTFDNDAQGRPLQLREALWRIDYEYDGDAAQAAPSRLFARRSDGIELRLRIDEWNPLSTPTPTTDPQ